MSEQRQKRIRAVREVCREKQILVFHESQYPSPARIARLGGRRLKGTKIRQQDRTANGMIYHLPDAETVYKQGYINKRIYLLHFGEPAKEVELSIAQLQLFNPTDRSRLIVLICLGERPS